jgi:hypothetical protein
MIEILLALARTAGIGRRRVDEVIELAGLGEVAGIRGFVPRLALVGYVRRTEGLTLCGRGTTCPG